MENLEQIKNSLQTFGEFQPTEFDRKGKGTDFENRDWLVSSIQLNRDSGLIEKSNWLTFIDDLRALEPEGGHLWDIHRFNHWACGWFEIVILNPNSRDSRVLDQALVFESTLQEYPILSEDRLQRLQLESFNDWVDDIGLNEVYNKIDDDEILGPFYNQFKNSDIIYALNECGWEFDNQDEPYIDIEEHWPFIRTQLLNEFEFETLSPACNGSNAVYFFVYVFYKDIIGADQKVLDELVQGKNVFKNSEKILENFNDLKVIIEDKVWNCFQDPSGSLEAIRYNI
tara:strand:+ start:220 stop:1071 length:852 start_codon:yes stop_codon:yes gene_type:complete